MATPLVRWGTRERRAARRSAVASSSGRRAACCRLGPPPLHVVQDAARIGASRATPAPVPLLLLHSANSARAICERTRAPILSSPAHANVCLFTPPLSRADTSLRDRTSRAMFFLHVCAARSQHPLPAGAVGRVAPCHQPHGSIFRSRSARTGRRHDAGARAFPVGATPISSGLDRVTDLQPL